MWISKDDLVLVGLREELGGQDKPKSDIIVKYTQNEVKELKNLN